MAVYVDQINIKFGRMIMNHLMADTTEELLDMIKKIGVHQKWIQDKDTYREHFDICLSKKAKALALGAIEVGWREICELMEKKKLEMTSKENNKVVIENP